MVHLVFQLYLVIYLKILRFLLCLVFFNCVFAEIKEKGKTLIRILNIQRFIMCTIFFPQGILLRRF